MTNDPAHGTRLGTNGAGGGPGSTVAGDWIPMRTDLAEDPAVVAIAAATGLDEFAVVGRLHRLWSWASAQLTSGKANRISCAYIDALVRAQNFSKNLEIVGWLRVTEEGVVFPKFHRWNSQTAKRRALAAQRAAKHRSRKSNDGSVTKSAPTEEKKKSTTTSSVTPPIGEKEGEAPTSPSREAQRSMGKAVLVFPCDGPVSLWTLTEEKLAEYCETYPRLDVLAEFRKALQWVRDNPDRRKTARGMPAFLSRWLSQAQDRGGGTRRAGGLTDKTARTVENVNQWIGAPGDEP